MHATRFFRYELRTTDVSAARAFYADLLGPRCWDAELSVSPLPERARALGAPSHWLGDLAVEDPAASAERFIALGAQQLGPTLHGADGSLRIVLRDPFGAVVALSRDTAPPRRDLVAWHGLAAHDHERAFTLYSQLFGWQQRERHELGLRLGEYQSFAWGESEAPVGSMSSIAAVRPVHPQWLFYFGVADLEHALARVMALGGKVMGTLRSADGGGFAACDDAQDAGFGLYRLRA
jgi:predicted enzyme related to lactoylglutathione lyase